MQNKMYFKLCDVTNIVEALYKYLFPKLMLIDPVVCRLRKGHGSRTDLVG
jgi:hypothetical protein